MTFEFDDELTLDAFAHSGMVDLAYGNVTLYAVVCIGSGEEPHFSHGGALSLTAEAALQAAKQGNDEEPYGNCRYLPTALGLSVEDLFALANRVALNIAGEEAP